MITFVLLYAAVVYLLFRRESAERQTEIDRQREQARSTAESKQFTNDRIHVMRCRMIRLSEVEGRRKYLYGKMIERGRRP